MKKTIITILAFLTPISLVSCSHQQPVFTFNLNELDTKASQETTTKKTQGKLSRNPQSAISVAPTKVLQLWIDNAYLAQLYDKNSIKEGYSGRREVLIYAIIYKDGIFQKFSKITDLANSMSSYQPVVVQKPNFFTETIDSSYYQITIKAFEVDTEGLVRILRRVDNTDVSKIASGSTPYAPGATFVSGFQTVLHGLFDMILSVTGKSVDDWVEQIASDKVFEHSIYVVPASAGDSNVLGNKNGEIVKDEQKLVLIASGDDQVKDLNDDGKTEDTLDYPIWSKLEQAGLPEGCSSFLLGEVVIEPPSMFSKKDCLKSADFKIAEQTKAQMKKIEDDEYILSELGLGTLKNNTSKVLNNVSHITITAIAK